jgi:hypothetical protein
MSAEMRNFARGKRASLLTLGHSSELDGPRLIAALHPNTSDIMKQTSRGLAPSLNTGHSTFTGARQRLAVALARQLTAFNLNFGDGEATGIRSLTPDPGLTPNRFAA